MFIVGSNSDLPKIEAGLVLLDRFGIDKEVIIASAHRTPQKVMNIAKNADKKYELVIAGAGMAAHLPGVIASYTILPVIGLPISSSGLAVDGAKNAAILAAQILAIKYPAIRKHLIKLKKDLRTKGKI